MHRSESRDRVGCLDCGSEISDARDRAFTIGESGALCFQCALRRGGKYDELHDTWEKAPSLSGLPLPDPERSRIWK